MSKEYNKDKLIMKKIVISAFALLVSLCSVQAQDTTASVNGCNPELKTGFRVHGLSYEFGQENLEFIDKDI